VILLPGNREDTPQSPMARTWIPCHRFKADSVCHVVSGSANALHEVNDGHDDQDDDQNIEQIH
jgi:hypothetical protein